MSSAKDARRAQLRRYVDVLAMWESRRYDTADIAERVGLAEGRVAAWIANWRDLNAGLPGEKLVLTQA